jgi:acetyltransferase-like isoleucine patch superfamily enzyme
LKGLFDYAIFTAETLSLENNNTVNGYNSSTGQTDLPIQIGTKSTAPDSIKIGVGSTIDGNVVVGAGGNPATVIYNDGTIVGLTYPASEEHVFPTITAPTLPDMGTIDVPGTVTLGPADTGKYAAITSFGGVLEIAGGDVVLHITGNIVMDGGSEIQIQPGSSLTIYADADISFVNGAGINNQTEICKNLTLYATSSEGEVKQAFELKNNSEAFGAIYAPNADIILKNNATLYGSVTCNSLTVKNNGTFSYDMALRDVTVYDESVRFLVKRWNENE